MQVFPVVISLIVLCLASGASILEAGHKSAARVAQSAKKAFLPKSWSNFHTLTSKSQGSPTGYLVVEEFLESNTCKSDASFYYGMGTGVCLVGIDETGKTIGSSILTYTGTKNVFMTYNTTIFASGDCTGATISNEQSSAPTSCMEASSTTGIKYSFTTNATPWTAYKSGLVNKFYDTVDTCQSTVSSGTYAWYDPSGCWQSTNDDGSEGGVQFTCDATTMTVRNFADPACAVKTTTFTVPLMVCSDNTPEAGQMNTANFVSSACIV